MNEILLEKLDEVNAEVDRLLSTSPLVIRKYTKHLATAKGKGVRALSVLVSALDEDDNIDQDAIHFATSIEILHLATLVHDDVMDDADTRRGVITLHKKYGKKTAVICGDYLLALSMHHLNQISDKEKYIDFQIPAFMLDIALGELSQHINNGNLDLTMPEYLEIIRGKTAKLFEASFYAGIITHNHDEATIDRYRKFGDLLGLMFQITDDCIDFESSRDEALKPVQSDFEQGVMTLPLIYAFEQDPSLKKKRLSRDLVNKIVEKFDGVSFAKKQVDKYYNQALSILDELEMTDLKRECMLEVLEMARR